MQPLRTCQGTRRAQFIEELAGRLQHGTVAALHESVPGLLQRLLAHPQSQLRQDVGRIFGAEALRVHRESLHLEQQARAAEEQRNAQLSAELAAIPTPVSGPLATVVASVHTAPAISALHARQRGAVLRAVSAGHYLDVAAIYALREAPQEDPPRGWPSELPWPTETPREQAFSGWPRSAQ